MAEKIRRVDYFYFTCDDRPGEGVKVLGKLRDAKVNLLAVSAFPGSGGKSQITVIPEKADALQAAARGAGLAISPRKECFLVQGDDRVGAGYDVLNRLAEAKVNVIATAAAASGTGHYGMAIFVKAADLAPAAKALGV